MQTDYNQEMGSSIRTCSTESSKNVIFVFFKPCVIHVIFIQYVIVLEQTM